MDKLLHRAKHFYVIDWLLNDPWSEQKDVLYWEISVLRQIYEFISNFSLTVIFASETHCS